MLKRWRFIDFIIFTIFYGIYSISLITLKKLFYDYLRSLWNESFQNVCEKEVKLNEVEVWKGTSKIVVNVNVIVFIFFNT
jgi:hypothetical protein